jgi:ESCRT-II complex subunit VPS36
VSRTEYYAGLFKSSPKVTLHLAGGPATMSQDPSGDSEQTFENWECEVCGYRNPPGLSPAAARICGLCGVPRSSAPIPVASLSIPRHLSSSLPSSTVSSSFSLSPATQDNSNIELTACPACTYLNDPSLRSCEICSTDLPSTSARSVMRSEPSSRPVTPDSDDESTAATRMVKISFRKGGDKAFYTVLKRSLKSKIWEVRYAFSKSGFSYNVSPRPMDSVRNMTR